MQAIPLDRVSQLITTNEAPADVCVALRARGIDVHAV
jgi:hypothetical protein